jgi:hypothetical protein
VSVKKTLTKSGVWSPFRFIETNRLRFRIDLYVFDCNAGKLVTMIAKCILFLFAATMLANCCALGNGCAPTSAVPAGWDGLGAAPAEDTQAVEAPPPRKQARAKREIILGPLDATATDQTSRSRPRDQWEKDQAADQDDEARLKRTLRICSAC